MSAHRSLMATATPLCLIGLLWSGIASADPSDRASSGLAAQRAPTEGPLPPVPVDPGAVVARTPAASQVDAAGAGRPRPDLSSAHPGHSARSDGAEVPAGGPLSRLAGLAFADASGAAAGAGSTEAPSVVEKPEAAAAPTAVQTPPRAERRAPFWNTRRGLGVAAAALGFVGFGISAWYAAQNGQPTGSAECSLGELPNQPCRYNTTDQFAFGFAASNLGLALGIALFSSAHLN